MKDDGKLSSLLFSACLSIFLHFELKSIKNLYPLGGKELFLYESEFHISGFTPDVWTEILELKLCFLDLEVRVCVYRYVIFSYLQMVLLNEITKF